MTGFRALVLEGLHYALVHRKDARITIRLADRPEGPWSNAMIEFDTLHSVPGWYWTNTGVGHPEFARDGGRTEYMTYRRNDMGRGEIRLMEVRFARYLQRALLQKRVWEEAMNHFGPASIVLAALALGCDTSEPTSDRACSGGRVCGFIDHHYNSTFYCPPAPFMPGGWQGYTWRDKTHCHQECNSASSWGCDASGCDSSCENDTGPGTWNPCDAANGGTETSGGCFLEGSGVRGETVPCVCQ